MDRLFQDFPSFFSTGGFMPHGQCYLWKPALVWTHFTSDLLIGIAYIGISLLLYGLIKKIKLPFSGMFLAFGAFIAFCGMTHLMAVWNLWHSEYWISAGVKAVTAAASIATWLFLFPVKPKVVEMAGAARLSEERKVKLESANEKLTQLYERIKESDRQKTQFFANVSHELRTPLTLLIGPAEKLARDESLSRRPRQMARVMLRNARTLIKQVNDLLDLSKLEAGRLQPSYVRTDLVRLLRVTSAHFESVMQSRSLEFTLRTPEAMEAQVDTDKMQRVFMNLLSNAIKFTPEGGRVEVDMRWEDEHAVIVIRDSGPGIRAEHRQVIFERFRQGEGGIDREFGGTGLGLTIVRDFLEMHGGSVRLLDQEDSGAAFRIEIPLTAPKGAHVAAPAAQKDEGGRMLEGAVAELTTLDYEDTGPDADPAKPAVLVCEDNPDMRHFIADSLAPHCQVILCADGSEGLDRARAMAPDLIISDIMMPRMGGDELMRRLRRDESLRRVPVLLLSARDDEELRIRLLKEGASDYVLKPFEAEELIARALNLVALKKTREILETELQEKSDDLIGLASEVAFRTREANTARQTAEAARERAEQSNEAKGAFLSLASHELNTPLTTLCLNLEMLKRIDALRDSGQGATMLGRAHSSALHLKQLVEELLEYTRVESGRLKVESKPTDMARITAESLAEVEVLTSNRNVVLIKDVAPDLPLFSSDPRLVKLVLNNLLSNAIKFTREGEVVLSCHRQGEEVIIQVKDSGPGIPAEDQARIFDPFEQLEPLTHKRLSGVGLGLSLVRRLVHALGGEISLSSDPGAGSVFTVSLPAGAPAA